MSVLVEVVAFCVEDVLRAKQAGAHRVELCADRGAGGTTPSYGAIKQSIGLKGIDVMVMIRPRGGDFLYRRAELDQMQIDIEIAAKLGARGAVFGILDENGRIDSSAMPPLVRLAKNLNLEVTCHRAFDVTVDPRQALQDLIDLGVDRVLTSGQQKTAVDGIPLLRELIKLARGRISIMPGSGVRPHNVHELLKLGITEIHTGSSVKVPSEMKAASRIEVGVEDSQKYHEFVDPDAVRAIVKAAAAK